MIGAIVRVVRGEGMRSAAVRAGERIGEACAHRLRLARGLFAQPPASGLVNMLMTSPSPRNGGVAVQLGSRLAEERRLRTVALVHGGVLEVGGRAWRRAGVEGRAFVVEGAFETMPALPDRAELALSIHDFTLLAHPSAAEWLARARVTIFPSNFLRDRYRAVVPRFEARVIAPGITDDAVRGTPVRNRVAFVGGVRPHKGGALLSEILRAVDGIEAHVFGGGDVGLLRALRGRARIHGYYRNGSLARLLASHGIGVAVLPSIFDETFSLTLSECWRAGVPVVAFDHNAVGERIRAHGGGFLVPHDAGAAGIAVAIRNWLSGATTNIPEHIPTARDAAEAHVALYRQLGWIER